MHTIYQAYLRICQSKYISNETNLLIIRNTFGFFFHTSIKIEITSRNFPIIWQILGQRCFPEYIILYTYLRLIFEYVNHNIKWNSIKICSNNMTNFDFPVNNVFPKIIKFPKFPIKRWEYELITQFHEFYYLLFIFAESGLISKQHCTICWVDTICSYTQLRRGKKVKTDQKSYYR